MLDFAIVLDRSYSTSCNQTFGDDASNWIPGECRIDKIRAFGLELVDMLLLGPYTTQISVVAFDDFPEVLIPLSYNKSELTAAISALEPGPKGASSNFGRAITAAADSIIAATTAGPADRRVVTPGAPNSRPGARTELFLLSDGLPTDSSPSQYVDGDPQGDCLYPEREEAGCPPNASWYADQAKAAGVEIYVAGFDPSPLGYFFAEVFGELLRDVASDPDETHAYIDTDLSPELTAAVEAELKQTTECFRVSLPDGEEYDYPVCGVEDYPILVTTILKNLRHGSLQTCWPVVEALIDGSPLTYKTQCPCFLLVDDKSDLSNCGFSTGEESLQNIWQDCKFFYTPCACNADCQGMYTFGADYYAYCSDYYLPEGSCDFTDSAEEAAERENAERCAASSDEEQGTGPSAQKPLYGDVAPFPGYSHHLTVSGTIGPVVTLNERHSIPFDLDGVDHACATPPEGGDENACGIHVHAAEGASCEEVDDWHLWVGRYGVTQDPWPGVTYTAQVEDANDPFSGATARGLVTVKSGATHEELIGKPLIIHDYQGDMLACAVLLPADA